MELETWLFIVIPLTVAGLLGGLLFITQAYKEKTEPVPTQVLGRPTYFRSNKRISKRGLLIGLVVLGLAYYLGSRKEGN